MQHHQYNQHRGGPASINTSIANTNNNTMMSSGGGGGKGTSGSGGGGRGRGSGSSKTTHSRSYPRGVGLDFRKLAGLTLMGYIDHHGKTYF